MAEMTLTAPRGHAEAPEASSTARALSEVHELATQLRRDLDLAMSATEVILAEAGEARDALLGRVEREVVAA